MYCTWVFVLLLAAWLAVPEKSAWAKSLESTGSSSKPGKDETDGYRHSVGG